MTAPSAAPTIEAARRDLGRRLKDAGVDSPELDARLLVSAALDLDLTALVAQANRPLAPNDAARLAAVAERRLAGEPVARIIGEKEFWGLRFKLSPDTLVPRADTETVVEAALDFARSLKPETSLRILDIGTGSGAILLALLSELPRATGIGTDISPGALAKARQNAESLGLSKRVRFVASDYFSAISGMFAVIVSNPPYVRAADIESLAPEVRGHEPRRALNGGADGLDAYRILCMQARNHLVQGGAFIVEVGHDQAEDIARLMTAASLSVIRPFRRDLGDVARVVEGRN